MPVQKYSLNFKSIFISRLEYIAGEDCTTLCLRTDSKNFLALLTQEKFLYVREMHGCPRYQPISSFFFNFGGDNFWRVELSNFVSKSSWVQIDKISIGSIEFQVHVNKYNYK